MAEHTPGPWEWSGDYLHGPDYHRVIGEWFAHGECGVSVPNDADKALLAAAPDLLAVAKTFLSMLHEEWHPYMSQADFVAHPFVVKVRAAIKKARGE